jgi:acyl CoA:acetate/3-ketoacid CoA transferase beta subunit
VNPHAIVGFVDAFRGSGEILISAFGDVPQAAARIARATIEPDIVLTDGEARAITADGKVEAWFPFRFVFDLLASGRRHVIMMPVQIDRFGNMNLSAIGDHSKPKVQVIGSRGAPGNTINHATSYWVPKHSNRVFVEKVDFVSGIGVDRGGYANVVVSDLGVFDFEGGSMRVRSLHPGVTREQVVESTGFELAIGEDVPTTRDPTSEEAELIDA